LCLGGYYIKLILEKSMASGLENIKKMVYPGRVIIIGKSPQGEIAVMYAITGRSPSSQARKLEIDEQNKRIFVKPTDEETLRKGNPDLLVYPAIICGDGIAVSNGKQTEDIFKNLDSKTNSVEILQKSLKAWEHEPDEPNYTPRISGCIANGAGLSILKRAEDGSVIRNSFEISMLAGRGKMIATYSGVNQNPLPSFSGQPQDADLPWSSVGEAVNALYEALGPEQGQPDFRVTAAAVFVGTDGAVSMKVKNRNQ
jgi:IMP cyclohydrolase